MGHIYRRLLWLVNGQIWLDLWLLRLDLWLLRLDLWLKTLQMSENKIKSPPELKRTYRTRRRYALFGKNLGGLGAC
jgi:hypothetical protein